MLTGLRIHERGCIEIQCCRCWRSTCRRREGDVEHTRCQRHRGGDVAGDVHRVAGRHEPDGVGRTHRHADGRRVRHDRVVRALLVIDALRQIGQLRQLQFGPVTDAVEVGVLHARVGVHPHRAPVDVDVPPAGESADALRVGRYVPHFGAVGKSVVVGVGDRRVGVRSALVQVGQAIAVGVGRRGRHRIATGA